MRRELVAVAVAAALSIPLGARAADGGSPPTGRDASAAGEPTTAEATPPGDPHGHDPGEDPHGDGMLKNPDRVLEDPRLPPGAVAVQVLDASNQPVPRSRVTLGILRNTVAKGESRDERVETADDQGRLVFRDLATGNGVSYRVSVTRDGGLFSAAPFGLSVDKGTLVLLHVFPVATEAIALDAITSLEAMNAVKDKALVLVEGVLYAELRDDRVQFQQLYRVANAGQVAWAPRDLVLPLPEGFTSFVNDTPDMGDVGTDLVPNRGLRLRGTFGPGSRELTFRWQLRYDGADKVTFDLPLPPNTVSMRVIAAAGEGMHLSAAGFPPAQPQSDGRGQRVLLTERQLRRGEPAFVKVAFALTDIPPTVPKDARLAVSALAALGVLSGLALLRRGRRAAPEDATEARRALLLADLEELVRAHRAGDIGPKTYERARRELEAAIARTFPAEA